MPISPNGARPSWCGRHYYASSIASIRTTRPEPGKRAKGFGGVTVLVTGSSGHLGEALVRTLQAQRRDTIGIDVLPGAFTHHVGSITDRAFVRRCMKHVTTVLHAATLHKPHVATHRRQDFVDVNISGTLNLLEEATAAGGTAFVYTSTTSVFGDALVP